MILLQIISCISLAALCSAIKIKPDLREAVPGFEDDDIPQKNNLEGYISALERLVNFYVKYSNEVDINTIFGFFMIDVNLKSALRYKPKGLPTPLLNRFNGIVQKNKKILNYFHMMAGQTKFLIPFHKQLRKKANLYSDENLWVSGMIKPEKSKLKDPEVVYENLVARFSSYSEYINKISKVKKIMPSYTDTDNCLIKLADNSVFHGKMAFPKCKLPQECVDGISKGNDEGYGLVNRLSILLQARFGRRCSVLSEGEDKKITEKLCSNAYFEATFISLYNFEPIMLLIDQMTFCSLNGNLEFLRSPWISYLLALQTPYGCFSDYIITDSKTPLPDLKPSSRWILDKGNQYRQPGTDCYGPASAGAAAIISAGIKYILEYTYDGK